MVQVAGGGVVGVAAADPWPPTPILSINAIDGSVIDLMKGY